MVSTLEQMQVPNGTGPGVRTSKRPLIILKFVDDDRDAHVFLSGRGTYILNNKKTCLYTFLNQQFRQLSFTL